MLVAAVALGFHCRGITLLGHRAADEARHELQNAGDTHEDVNNSLDFRP